MHIAPISSEFGCVLTTMTAMVTCGASFVVMDAAINRQDNSAMIPPKMLTGPITGLQRG